jgi:hypothetical protein
MARRHTPKPGYVPPWTDNQILQVRRLHRAGKCTQTIKEAIESPLCTDTIASRMRALGMKPIHYRFKRERRTALS